MDYRDWELYFKVSARRNFQRLDITPLQATNLKEQVISILRKKRMPKNRPATGDQSMGYRQGRFPCGEKGSNEDV